MSEELIFEFVEKNDQKLVQNSGFEITSRKILVQKMVRILVERYRSKNIGQKISVRKVGPNTGFKVIGPNTRPNIDPKIGPKNCSNIFTKNFY